MQACNLKVNHLVAPLGIDAGPLFVSWCCEGGMRQSAYELELCVDDAPVWQSGKVQSSLMHVTSAFETEPHTCYELRVRLWDENGAVGEWACTRFETCLAQEDWQAQWVNPETAPYTLTDCPCTDAINAFARPNWERKQAELEASGKGEAVAYEPHKPASYLRKTFQVEGAVAGGAGSDSAVAGGACPDGARLYITAKGLYVAWLNGQRVGEFVLAPGSFTADKHLGYQTYDVTDLLHEGQNELLVALGDGWQRSVGGVDGDRNLYGSDVELLFQLEVAGKAVCVSDANMQATQLGPIQQNDLQQGEVYDARLEGELEGCAPEGLTGWHGVATAPLKLGELPLVGMNTVPVLEHERFEGKLITTPNGETVLDFGQNIAGYVEMLLDAHAGERVLLTCGETLDENGNFTTENFQDRARHKEGGTAQMLELICKEGHNTYKPSFTIMGFRYAKVEGTADLSNAKFVAYAVYSDMPALGSFECSNTSVNKLVQNSIWSQKGNFCDVPTDCPTRERAAWTGDMGVFIETGLDLMDCTPVVAKWLGECRLNQYDDGRMANIAPPNSRPGQMTAMLCMSAGWGDASILVPYALYKRTGDVGILRDNYEIMRRWYAFLYGRAQATTPEQQTGEWAKYTVLTGLDYGEWCEPGITPMQAMMNPRKSVGTAYLAYSGKLLAEIAEVLGKPEDAAKYLEVSHGAMQAYRAAFTNDGVIDSERQCEYVRPLAFGLLESAEARAAADTLNEMVIANGYHLNTGFLSTPYLCAVLAEYGYTDTAYKLLLQDTAPSWLYEVDKGATTVWETWEGIDAEGKPHESLNHYSYGAICGWLFGGVCGIKLDVAAQKLSIAPVPDPALGWAKATYDSPCGCIESSWRYENGTLSYEFVVPANMEAEVSLPDGRNFTLQPGTHTL